MGYPADANFYNLNQRWEKENLSGSPKKAAIEESFSQVLSGQAAATLGPPPPPALQRTLTEITQAGRPVEIEQKQSLYIKGGGIVKFVATEEGIVSLDTMDANTLRAQGVGIGITFLHIWDAQGRHTFELHVLQPKFIPSQYQLDQAEAIEKSRSFKFGYNNNRGAYYTGHKFTDKVRSGLDFVQNFNLQGDTPYGALSSRAQTQKLRGKTLLTDAQISLKDGKIGAFKNFDLELGDTGILPSLMVLPGARVRGAQASHWNNQRSILWTGFYGREESSIIGTLTPGIVAKRTLDSFLSGGTLDLKLNNDARFKTGYFAGTGKSRSPDVNSEGFGTKGEMALGPHVIFKPELDFDNEHFAKKESLVAKFDKLRIRNEWRDISKNFTTLVGSPARQGEFGYLTEVSAEPLARTTFSGSLDIFQDRLIPNPEDAAAFNIHTDLMLGVTPADNTGLIFTFQDLDDTGRLGPTRFRSLGMQANQRINFLGHRASVFTRYQNRGSRILNDSLSNYLQNQVVLGFQTEIFWGINFSVQQEWNALKEPNINRFTRPHALTYNFDYSHEIGNTPFFMDTRLRIRDEEDTESPNSFMSGQDSTEISGGIYYREIQDLEIYLTGSFSNYNPESLNIGTHRIEAQFLTGMKYLYDTHWRWSSVGSFEGVVFKDKNGDGLRQPEEPGIEGILIKAGDDKKATTDKSGFYQLKSVVGKKAVLTLDTSKIPYGYAPTSSLRQEIEIIQSATQTVNFGLTPQSEITGIVFNDLNGDGKYDLTEGGIRRVKMALENGLTARTNNLGVYLFSNVIAGEHTASLDLATVPEGYLPEDVPKKSFTIYEGIRYELNFPLRAIRAVTGRVFVDENKNGSLDPGEPVLPNVNVGAHGRAPLHGDKSIVSDKDGWYLFDNLNKGSYVLSVYPSTLQAGFQAPKEIPVDLPAEPLTLTDLNIPITKTS